MPATDFGKAISRHNSTRHGLTPGARLLTPDLAADLPDRLDAYTTQYAHLLPHDATVPHLLRELAIAELRVERCQAADAAAASLTPDPILQALDDQRLAQQHFDRLPAHPARHYHQLLQSTAGCSRLARAWTHLDLKLQVPQPWSPADLDLALNLLGLEGNERLLHPDALTLTYATHHLQTQANAEPEPESEPTPGSTPESTPEPTPESATAAATHRDTLRRFIARQLHRLSEIAVRRRAESEAFQALGPARHELRPSPEVARVRRYEAANRRIYTETLARLEALNTRHAASESNQSTSPDQSVESSQSTETAGPNPEPQPTPATSRTSSPSTPPPTSFGHPAGAPAASAAPTTAEPAPRSAQGPPVPLAAVA